jgi:hypothetical protein
VTKGLSLSCGRTLKLSLYISKDSRKLFGFVPDYHWKKRWSGTSVFSTGTVVSLSLGSDPVVKSLKMAL